MEGVEGTLAVGSGNTRVHGKQVDWGILASTALGVLAVLGGLATQMWASRQEARVLARGLRHQAHVALLAAADEHIRKIDRIDLITPAG